MSITTTIKITELENIGSDLLPSSVMPVVNMTDNPVTEKVTVGQLATLILEEAGGSFPPASQSLLAATVLNGYQPNITGVGRLTTLIVDGNAAVNNLNVDNTIFSSNISATGQAFVVGDVTANAFIGNGSQLTNIQVNTSVTNFYAVGTNPGVSDTLQVSRETDIITVDSANAVTAYIILPTNPGNGKQFVIKKASASDSEVSVSADDNRTIDGESIIRFTNAWGTLTVFWDNNSGQYFVITGNYAVV